MAIKKEPTHAFTVKFPESLIEEIDQICSTNYITRTSWLVRAAKNALDNERASKAEEILTKISNRENKLN